MFKKMIALLLCLVIVLSALPALADGGSSQLINLKHNCPNTGKMLPERFDPDQTTYLLTVADWVSRVTFTPTAEGIIYVNGVQVKSGSASQIIQMTDEPQAVTIQVVNGTTTTYTVYLQRRPSERRTRVSAGYISSMGLKNDTWYIAADLVTVNYKSSKYSDGNRSTFINDSSYLYNYAVDPHCVFFYEENGVTREARDIYEFQEAIYAGQMYRIVYMEDKIVAVMPYSADY